MAYGKSLSIETDHCAVEITKPEKLLFPEQEISKADLANYYAQVSDWMLPHLKRRPLTLERFPDGIDGSGFVQQRTSSHFPSWIKTWKTPRAQGGDAGKGRAVEHVVCDDTRTLLYLTNQGVITFHGWLSRAPRIEKPDRMSFDLDPPGNDFSSVRQGAIWVTDLMVQLGLKPFVMTTGSRGLHVLTPLSQEWTFESVSRLAQAMARHLADEHPEELTVELRKKQRAGRLYLDVGRNACGQTGVVPYAVRARSGAPVATPLELSELDDNDVDAERFHVKNILRRLGQRADPWKDIERAAVNSSVLERARRQMGN